MTKLMNELLTEINEDVSLLKTKYQSSAALRLLFSHAFDKEKVFILPDTDPPYKQGKHIVGMAPTTLTFEAKRLYIFCRADLKPIKREAMFIDLLENLDDNEAKILLAVKNQTLHKLYPNITKAKVKAAGFL